jgi:hypothetical protein
LQQEHTSNAQRAMGNWLQAAGNRQLATGNGQWVNWQPQASTSFSTSPAHTRPAKASKTQAQARGHNILIGLYSEEREIAHPKVDLPFGK